MRIHDRYILRLLVTVMLLCVASLAVVFFLVDLFEKIDNFIDHQASVRDVLRFYVYLFPEIIRLTLPVVVLLSTIFTLGILGRNNEIIAFVASGISMLRLAFPILVMAGFTVAASAWLSEYVVPRTNAKKLRVRRVDIEKREAQDARLRHGFVYHGEGDIHYYASTFNTRTRALRDVTVFRYNDGHIVWSLNAEKGVWSRDRWEFRNGFYRAFTPGSAEIREAVVEQFHVRHMPELRETPEDLARVEPEPDAMNYVQLKAHIDDLRASGADVNDYLVDLHTKVSYPLTNLIMAVLGIGLSASKRKTGVLAGVGITLAIAFAYLALVEISEALGKNESISPMLAAWLGPLVFGVASIGLIGRVNR
jgi:lipopolysaccharide export system permease protein